ncbi:hypothetical protein [Gimesia fumaroli]|uniref:Nitrogen regulatory protein P-II n=1 Tax=Gimesia fumaroli TaxID=2527976 RepID=A0A518I8Z4_9PLAN|nr:hypothetical protein [Gimesia fumaroli]QDV49519.1 hypothetical protein Enr17x_15380 [Gimesia fumaroli]
MKEISTYLPLDYNDKTPVESHIIKGIIRDLTIKFGGCSVGSQGMGYWQDPKDGVIYDDRNVMVTIAVSEDQIDEAKSLITQIGKQLGQEAMYFKVTECQIDILDC